MGMPPVYPGMIPPPYAYPGNYWYYPIHIYRFGLIIVAMKYACEVKLINQCVYFRYDANRNDAGEPDDLFSVKWTNLFEIIG
jgi:hypothetical protein